jgi:RnfABCDGE-type electron transport complex G subunit
MIDIVGGIIKNKLFSSVFIIFIGVISSLVSLMMVGCIHDSLDLQCEQQTLTLLHKVFSEAGYYYYDDETDIYTIFNNEKDMIGYGFIATGKGYGGTMLILVGLEDKETIKGINVIEHNEILYMGEDYRIELNFNNYVQQFVGLNISGCSLVKDGGQVDEITGATISSRAVVDAVRELSLRKIDLIS